MSTHYVGTDLHTAVSYFDGTTPVPVGDDLFYLQGESVSELEAHLASQTGRRVGNHSVYVLENEGVDPLYVSFQGDRIYFMIQYGTFVCVNDDTEVVIHDSEDQRTSPFGVSIDVKDCERTLDRLERRSVGSREFRHKQTLEIRNSGQPTLYVGLHDGKLMFATCMRPYFG